MLREILGLMGRIPLEAGLFWYAGTVVAVNGSAMGPTYNTILHLSKRKINLIRKKIYYIESWTGRHQNLYRKGCQGYKPNY